MTSIAELLEPLPCPFCGASAREQEPESASGLWEIGCPGNWRQSACAVGAAALGSTRAEAIATWNRRAPLEALSDREAPEGGEAVAWHWWASDDSSTWPVWSLGAERPSNAPGAIPLYAHPTPSKPVEGSCDECHGPALTWFAPNALWNLVQGGPEATDDPGGMLCPNCFIRRAEAAGIVPTAWKLDRESPSDIETALALSAPAEPVAWQAIGEGIDSAKSVTADPATKGEPIAQVETVADTRCDYCKEHGFQAPNLCEDCRSRSASIPPSGVAGAEANREITWADVREVTNGHVDMSIFDLLNVVNDILDRRRAALIPSPPGVAEALAEALEAAARPDPRVLYANAVAAMRALDDYTHTNETEFTGWGDGIVPPGATWWRIKSGQALKALDELRALSKEAE